MTRPLDGIRVIGLEQYMAGPYCTMLLADAGAEVIKIERPGRGDPRRAMPPFVEKNGVRKAAGYMGYNRNKKSLALDLQSEDGRQVFRDLAAKSDVVVENLRPGAMEKIGLDYEALKEGNPRLIWALISGFGRLEGYRGAYSDRPAFDIVAEAMSGIMHLVGFSDKPPSWTIYGMADIYTGMCTAYGVMQALFMREKTGEGQLVDSAMFDAMLSLNEAMVTVHSAAGQNPGRGTSKNVWPRGAFRCSDGYIALNVPDEIIWKRLAETVGHPEVADDPKSNSAGARADHAGELRPLIEGWLARRTRAEAVDALNAAGVPTGPVNTAEDIFADPHVAERGLLMPIDDPEVGEFRFARTPVFLSEAPELPANAAPALGANTREILTGVLGYGNAQVERLLKDGVAASAAKIAG